MALTATQLVTLAGQAAKSRGFTAQAGQFLNSILSDLCQTYDLDLAKKALNFNFTPATAPIGNLNAQLASGPFKLPLDYLRTKIGDVLFFPNGLGNFPLRLTPIDLGEFDGLVQQAGFQNFPVFWVTDMSQLSLAVSVSGSATLNSTNLIVSSFTGLVAGQSISGPGIAPGTTIASVGGGVLTMSLPAIATATTETYSFGTPPIAYVWPPASGTYPCLVRYYSQMPDIVTPETSAKIPWFPNAEYLRKKLAAGLMELAGDDRHTSMNAEAIGVLDGYLKMKDDSTNRAQRVTLDRRRFGRAWGTLPPSKVYGY